MLFNVTIFSEQCAVWCFFGSSVHSSHVFSGRLASHLPCMGGQGRSGSLQGTPAALFGPAALSLVLLAAPYGASRACLQHHHLRHRACSIIVVNLHSAFYPRNLQFHPGGAPVLKRVQLHRLSRIIWAWPYMKPTNSFVIVDVMMIMCTTIFTVDVTTWI